MLGGAAVLDTGSNRGLRFEQRLEGGEGVSHVAGWWKEDCSPHAGELGAGPRGERETSVRKS